MRPGGPPPRPTARPGKMFVFICACIASANALGINLGNVLEAPTEGAWAPAAQEYYFADYKQRGFTTVRVPVRWDNHTAQAAPYTIDPSFMARVQQVVGWSLAQNFTTIINAHHDECVQRRAHRGHLCASNQQHSFPRPTPSRSLPSSWINDEKNYGAFCAQPPSAARAAARWPPHNSAPPRPNTQQPLSCPVTSPSGSRWRPPLRPRPRASALRR